MAYDKKILVLKQTDTDFCDQKSRLSGILRIETENGVADFHLSLINIPKELTGEYQLTAVDGKENAYHFSLGKTPSGASGVFESVPDFKSGIAVGVYCVKNDIPLTLAFARSDGFNFSLSDFKKLVAEKCLSDRKREIKKDEQMPIENRFTSCPNPSPIDIKNEVSQNNTFVEYDDEAVATVNYYELDENIEEKLETVKEICRGDLPLENELPFSKSQEETCEERARFNQPKNETNFDNSKKTKSGNYYLTVKDELNGVFATHELDVSLINIFPESKFVKIFYSKTKYYVVGLIKEDGKEKYICYGVPATYSPEPPKELKGFCSFIPLSVFDMKGKGFWMMFQCAKTGECIRIETV